MAAKNIKFNISRISGRTYRDPMLDSTNSPLLVVVEGRICHGEEIIIRLTNAKCCVTDAFEFPTTIGLLHLDRRIPTNYNPYSRDPVN